MSTDVDARRQELEEELARIAEAEKQEAEAKRQAAQAEAEAQLAPEQLARKAEIEKMADAALEREYPPAWLPQKDKTHPQKLVGIVLRIDPRVGPSKTFGTYSAVLEIRATDATEWTLWANESGAMYAQLLRLRVQPGEVIAVKYRGKKESQANPGQFYHDFRLVRVEDEEQPSHLVDYEALSRTGELPALTEDGQAPQVDDDIPF